MHHRRLSRITLVAMTLLAAPLLHAADFQTTRLDDPVPNGCAPGDCSLREAIIAAQANGSADRVLLLAGTYNLSFDEDADLPDGSTGPIVIDTPMEIVGSGRTATTLTADANLPLIFAVSLDAPAAHVTLSDFTIANVVSNAGFFGPLLVADTGVLTLRRFGMRDCTGQVALVVANGLLDVHDAVFENNTVTSASNGAVLYATRTPLVVDGTRFEDNSTINGAVLVAGDENRSLGQIDLRDNIFRGNTSAASGAAVSLYTGNGFTRLDLSDSVFEDNHAAGEGGAVYVTLDDDTPTTARLAVTANGTRFTGNESDSRCGALDIDVPTGLDLLEPPTLVMDLARFDGNRAGSFGGALCSGADTTLTFSTFSGNQALTQGGAIVATGPAMTIERSTLSGNSAGSIGGAVFSIAALTIDYSTISGNTAGSSGGGGGVLVTGLSANEIRHSTFAGNTANGVANVLRLATSPQLPATQYLFANILQGGCSITDPAAMLPNNYNIESPGNTCALSSLAFNQRNVTSSALALGALADNGGPTLTRLPGANSVARDPGVSTGDICATPDQRNYAGTDTHCDVGAVEASAVAQPSTPAVFADGFE